MAGFNPQSIGKYLADFKTFFSRNRRKRPDEDDTDLEIEDETQENPGDVKMNSGQHRNVYGIRKKIIGGIIAFGVLVFIGSYYISKPDTPTDQPARIPAQRLAPETREPAHTNEERKELSYADLKTLDAGRAKTANAQAAPGADGRPAGNGAANPPGAVTVQQIPTPSLPSAAPDAAYPIPHPNIPPAPWLREQERVKNPRRNVQKRNLKHVTAQQSRLHLAAAQGLIRQQRKVLLRETHRTATPSKRQHAPRMIQIVPISFRSVQ